MKTASFFEVQNILYINNAPRCTPNLTYQPSSIVDEKELEGTNTYFGGAGLGMPILCCFILNGAELKAEEVINKIYQVTEGETSITLSNTPNKQGAVITLMSPLAPFALAAQPVDKTITLIDAQFFKKKRACVISPAPVILFPTDPINYNAHSRTLSLFNPVTRVVLSGKTDQSFLINGDKL